MVAFMESVNASLPINEPDYILQTLLKGHAAASCGSQCPKGMFRSDDGHCVARSVIAEAPRPATAAAGNATIQAPPPVKTSGFTTTVRVANANPYPAAPPAVSTSTATATSSLALPNAVSALPGRMSIGVARPEKASGEAPWRISIVPTPAARRPEAKVPESQVAALPADNMTVPAQEKAALDDYDSDAETAAPIAPLAGMPGTKAGSAQARVRTAALIPAPSPAAAMTVPNRRVYVAPRPGKPARANNKRRLGYQTRSVRAIFSNPFGVR
jgi:hypothetical protein